MTPCFVEGIEILQPTREQICSEPAGLRMDCWIAEFVMKWNFCPEVQLKENGKSWACYKDSDNAIRFLPALPASPQSWSPSRNVLTAWELVDLFTRDEQKRRGEHYAGIFPGFPGWYVRLQGKSSGNWDTWVTGEGETFPLAVSRAVLLCSL